MTKQLTSINAASDTFQTWIDRTNEIVTVVNTEVVTVNSSVGVSTGNGFVNGIFGSNTLVATNIRGGNVDSNTVLTITSNLNVTDSRVSVGNSTVNTSILGSNITLANSTISYTMVLPTAAQQNNSNFVLSANGGWVFLDVAGSTVSGSNTFLQFNDGGVFGSVNTFVFHKSNNTLSVGNATVNTTVSPSTIRVSNSSTNVVLLSNSILINDVNLAGTITANASAAYTNAITIAANATNLTSGIVPSARLSGTYNITANNANNLNGQPASFYSNASNLTTGTVPPARLSGTYTITVSTANNATNFNGQDASFYTNATNISTGTLASARLGTSSNVQFGSLGVGTAASGTTGQIRATGDIIAHFSSDKSLKNNISNIENALEKVLSVRGVEFDWSNEYIEKNGGEDGYFIRKRDVGVIAQEIETVLPEVVVTRNDGIKAVKYDKIIALLIEAIKDLNDKLESIKETK